MTGAADSRREAFNVWVRAHGPTIADVARRAEVPQTTLYSYASGKSQSLKGITQEKIASAYRVRVEELFGDFGAAQPEIGVWGKIGARAEIYPLSDYTSDPMYQVQLPATLDTDLAPPGPPLLCGPLPPTTGKKTPPPTTPRSGQPRRAWVDNDAA